MSFSSSSELWESAAVAAAALLIISRVCRIDAHVVCT